MPFIILSRNVKLNLRTLLLETHYLYCNNNGDHHFVVITISFKRQHRDTTIIL